VSFFCHKNGIMVIRETRNNLACNFIESGGKMTKIVVLKLRGLKYSGDSIGSNLRIEIEASNHFVGINKNLSLGKNVEFNREIGLFFTTYSYFSLPVHLRVIERDPVFNDVGSLQVAIQVDLNNYQPQHSTHKIEVMESGAIFGKGVAVFHLILEAQVLQMTRYIAATGDGWLMVHFENEYSNIRKSLPEGLKVEIYHIDKKCEYFTVMEGAYQGRKASVKFNKEGLSYLSTDNPQTGPVQLVYSISRKILSLNGSEYLTDDAPDKPWKKGKYDIEIPNFPHSGGLNYPKTTRARTWFRVGHDGARYIHTGRISRGCITITENQRWDELCQKLINARKGDGISIGTLLVVE
jgi:hypothetical protein